MKQAAALGIPLLLLAGGLGFWFAKKTPPPAEERVPAALTQLFKSPERRPPQIVAVVVRTKEVDEACQEWWIQLQQLDLRALDRPTTTKIPSPGQCQRYPPEMKPYFAQYQKACSPFFAEGAQAKPSDEKQALADCVRALAVYRATVTRWQHRDEKISEISDPRVLVDLLAVSGLGTETPDESGAKAKQLVEKLWELDPNSSEITKYRLDIALSDSLLADEGEKSEAKLTEMRTWLERTERVAPDDPDLPMLRLFVDTDGFNPERLADEAERMASASPPLGLGYYYLAAATAKAGNTNDAERYLREALRIDPSQPAVQESWKDFQTSGSVSVTLPVKTTSPLEWLMRP